MFSEQLQDFFGNLGDIGVTCAVLAVVACYLLFQRLALTAVSLVGVSLACMGLTGLLKLYFCMRTGLPDLGLTEEAPSGHTTVNVVVYGGIAGILLANGGRGTWLGSCAFALLGLLIAFSRISEFGHSPEDVIFGLAIGTLGALAITGLAFHEPRKFDPKIIGALTAVSLLVIWGSGFRFDADEVVRAAARMIG